MVFLSYDVVCCDRSWKLIFDQRREGWSRGDDGVKFMILKRVPLEMSYCSRVHGFIGCLF